MLLDDEAARARLRIEEYSGRSLTNAEGVALDVVVSYPDVVVTRTRDVIQLDIGDEERGCVLLITDESVEIRLPTVAWLLPYDPRVTSRRWKRVKMAAVRRNRLPALIEEAGAARAAEFRACRYCGREFPPEHMSDKSCVRVGTRGRRLLKRRTCSVPCSQWKARAATSTRM